MNIFKVLFGGRKSHPEEQEEEVQNVDMATLEAENHDSLESQVEACITAGDYSDAYDLLRQLSEENPGNVDILLRMADVARMMKNYPLMSDACEKAILADNTNAQAYYLYAQACRQLGDTTNTVAMLTKALMLKPDFEEARQMLDGEPKE